MVEETHQFPTLGFQLQGVDFDISAAAEDPRVWQRERSTNEVLNWSWPLGWRAPTVGEIAVMAEVSKDYGREYAADLGCSKLVKGPIPQPLSSPKRLFYVTIFVLLMVELANAGAVDNILGNLGSDLAPLLALFGERVTMQYLSESLTRIDNFIFALAPLGIITAVVSAIRVAGGPKLRSLVGRAKESRGVVEAELMSSTSSDVCELWNDQGVVRVIGRPVILQLVYVPSKNPSDSSTEIFTFAEAVEQKTYTVRSKDRSTDTDSEAQKTHAFGNHLKNPPNLSSNIGTKSLQLPSLLVLVVFGTFLQAGVLVFAALIQYRSIFSIPEYAFCVIFGGTLLLTIGMFLCAQIIEESTDEAHWDPHPECHSDTEVIWIQQGGQTVGDQLFESFAKRKKQSSVMTSVKAPLKEASTSKNGLATKAREVIARMRIGIAVGASLVGFALQFVGLRATHPSVTLAQLVVILVMTAIRSFVHMERDTKNDIRSLDNQADGHELDWLAKNLKNCKEWQVVTGFGNSGYSVDAKTLQNYAAPAMDTEAKPPHNQAIEAEPLLSQSTPPAGAEVPPSQNQAIPVMKIRARLAQLSKEWKLKNRTKAKGLKNAIEETMNQAYATMALKSNALNLDTFTWALRVKCQLYNEKSSLWEVYLTLNRRRDGDGNWTVWRTDETDLEAVLCLWISFIRETKLSKPDEEWTHVRLLGPDTPESKEDYKLWVQRETVLVEGEGESRGVIYFGWAGDDRNPNDDNVSYLRVKAEEDLATLCAQELYTWFIFKLATAIKDVQGETTPRTNNPTTEASLGSDFRGDAERFCLINSNLALFAASYSSSGLGSVESAYMCIVPAFRASGKLPFPDKALAGIRDFWAGEGDVRSRLLSPDGHALLQNISAGGLDKILEWLLNAGAEINPFPGATSSRTPLQAAAECGRDKTIKLLLSRGADINAEPAEDSGRTALQAAAGAGHAKTVQLLLSSGAEVNAMPARCLGRTALQAAAQAGHREIVGILLDAGVEVNAAPAAVSGRTVLQAVAEGGDKDLAQLLLRKGADVNAPPSGNSGRTALQAAAQAGHKEIVEWLLEAGADVNAAPAAVSGRTALQLVVECGDEGLVQLLLSKGADANAPLSGDSGRTALQVAAGAGYGDIVKLLLTAGANINDAPEGPTAIFLAAGAGHMEIVKFLLQEGADTPLDVAAGAGYEEVVRLLLAAGVAVDAVSTSGSRRTALQEAAQAGHRSIAELLLTAGANINDAPGGRTAIFLAAKAGHIEIVKFLLQGGADPQLDVVAGAGYEEAVKLLLVAGADVNAVSTRGSGSTALQAAAKGDYEGIVQLLLNAGADINVGPRTALQVAAGDGHESIVRLLLKAGANVNAGIAYESGRTALQAASEGGYESIVQLLLKAGADIDARPARESGRTALQAAAEGGHKNLVKLLLEAGADVNAERADVDGITALQAAARSGHERMVQLFLEAGADANAKPAHESGRTALQAAAAGGHERMVQLLLKAGADVNAKPASGGGRTALQAAAGGGQENLKLVELLLKAGANANAERADLDGITALQAVAGGGHERMVQLLLEAGADVNAGPAHESGRTALQAAAGAGHENLVQLLLKAGADVNAGPAYESGRTALQAAAGAGHENLVQLLLKSGADVNAKPARRGGRTALLAAAEGAHLELCQILRNAGAREGGGDYGGDYGEDYGDDDDEDD